MIENNETDANAEAERDQFRSDVDLLAADFKSRFGRHLEEGQPVAAMEALLLSRLISLRKFSEAKEWATECQGSLDNGV